MLKRLLFPRHRLRYPLGEVAEDLFDSGRLGTPFQGFHQEIGEVAVSQAIALEGSFVVFAGGDDERALSREEELGGLAVDADAVDRQPLGAGLAAEAGVE